MPAPVVQILTLLKSDATPCKQQPAGSSAAPGAFGGVQAAGFGGVQHEQLESEREVREDVEISTLKCTAACEALASTATAD